MRTYNKHGSCRLKTDAPLDADYCVSHMHVAADSVRAADFLDGLDGLNLVVVFNAVHRANLALLEFDCEGFIALFGDLFEVCRLREALLAVQNLAAADGGAPDADVVGIFQFCKIGLKTVRVEVINLLFAAQVAVAGQGDDLHLRAHHQESHVKTDLVVAGAGGAVRNCVGANLLGIAGDGHSLEYALGRYADRVGAVAQHIAPYHIFKTLLVILFGHVQGNIFGCAQFIGVLLVGFELLRAETAGICARGVHLIALLFCKIHHRVRCIQSAAERDYNFFLAHIVILRLF